MERSLPSSQSQLVLNRKDRRTSNFGILPLRQLESQIEELTKDEIWGTEILDWVLPDVKIANWGLPGHGEKKDSCGTFFMKGCLNVSEHPDNLAVFKPMVNRCFSPQCPEDWLSWAMREADRIADRIGHVKGLGKPIHYMESVPKALWYVCKNNLTAFAYRIGRKVGFLGGSVIYHPFREKGRRWYFSPHFHFIGFGFIDGKKVAETYKTSGWICKNLGVRKSVYGTAFYQLTHCGVWYGTGKRHSVTWCGVCSYNKLNIPKPPLDQLVCPYCGKSMERLDWVGSEPMPLPCSGIGGFYLASSEGWDSFSNKCERSAREREHYCIY